MSPAEASSTCEAICLPFSITLAAASTIAAPDFMIEREPPVPPPTISSIAVALQQPDALERHAELLAQHLRERRGVALAVIERAGEDGDAAVGVEADAAHLLVGGRGDFEIAADADAAQLAALLALALALGEALPVGSLQRLLEDRREVAAVIGRAGGGLVGNLALADLVRRRSSIRSMPVSAAA